MLQQAPCCRSSVCSSDSHCVASFVVVAVLLVVVQNQVVLARVVQRDDHVAPAVRAVLVVSDQVVDPCRLSL